MGGTLSPLIGKSLNLFQIFLFLEGLKMMQQDHIIDQTGLIMYGKRQKVKFLDLNYMLFSGIFLRRIGGYPLPLLTENHSAQKSLAEFGGTPLS